MRYLTGLMLCVLANIASAADAECQVNGSGWVDAEVSAFNVYVDVRASTSLKKVLLNYFSMNCRHRLSAGFSPSLQVTTQSDAVRFSPQYRHLNGGLVRLADIYNAVPVQAGLVLGTHTTGPYVSVSGGPYLDITTTPGKYIDIKSGALIASVHLTMRLSSPVTGTRYFNTTVFVYARNSLNLNPSTCTINDNKPIEVDFGSVDPVAIPESQYDSTTSRAVALNYSCPDLGITTPILIILQGSGALFNLGGLATSNTDLAIRMVRNNGGVPVGLPFGTNITNSSGGDTVVFSLYRKPGSVPAAGPFTASGTLVMSVP